MSNWLAQRKPVIGISGSHADSASLRAMVTQIASAGAVPVFLGNHSRRDPEADINKIDALVVMGGDSDIEPARYDQQKHNKTISETDDPEARDRADMNMI